MGMKLTKETLVGTVFIEGGFAMSGPVYKKVVHLDTVTGQAVVVFLEAVTGYLATETVNTDSLLDNLNRGFWKVVSEPAYRSAQSARYTTSHSASHKQRHF